jgi:hypothetical protein
MRKSYLARAVWAVPLAWSLACAEGEAPAPAEPGSAVPVDAEPALAPETPFQGTWRQLAQVGSEWQIETGCGIDADIALQAGALSSGGCSATVTSAREVPQGVALTVQQEGAEATVTATWVDAGKGVAEWSWPGCMNAPVRAVHSAQEEGFSTKPCPEGEGMQ